jgi:hypothetical protein
LNHKNEFIWIKNIGEQLSLGYSVNDGNRYRDINYQLPITSAKTIMRTSTLGAKESLVDLMSYEPMVMIDGLNKKWAMYLKGLKDSTDTNR